MVQSRLVDQVNGDNGAAAAWQPTHESGCIEVSARVHERVVSIRVFDNGLGIAPVLMPNLFDLYTQAERSSDSRNSGLGLRLALFKSLVEAHDGEVTATSPAVNFRTTFCATLPFAARRRGSSALITR